MRPMRLHKREITDPEILREIIEECDLVRIGASDSDGIFVVPVNYGYDLSFQNGKADLKLYIHGAGEGRKAEAFASNPLVAVEMDRMVSVISGDYTCSYSCAYQSIMGNGSIRRLDGKQEKIYALTRIMEHMAPEAEIQFSPEMLARTAVFQINVDSFTGKERKQK